MSSEFSVVAEIRTDKGKGASRRLRRAGKVPAVIYGDGGEAISLAIAHDPIAHQLENEAFYASILEIDVDGKKEQAVLKDLQRHPYKRLVMHVDFLRVNMSEKLRLSVPIHIQGEESCPGVKQGGSISHLLTEIEVSCLPSNLPESLSLDVSNLVLDETLRLSDIALPDGVEIVELTHGEGHDQAVVSVHVVHVAAEPEDDAEVDEAGEAAAGEGGDASEE